MHTADTAVCDIIVRGKGNHELTRLCLDSIRRNTPQPHNLIVVDDGSSPAYEFECDYAVRSAVSRGAVTATNLGVSVALTTPAPYVLILDNDTEIPEGDTGWLSRFIAELTEFDDTACVGATSSFVNQPQHIRTAPNTYTGDWNDGKRFGVKENPGVVWFVSFAVLFRKEVLASLGPWDERYNPGNWEDTDYAMTCRTNGYQVRVARSVYIHHRGHKTFGSDLNELMRRNQEKFVGKWGLGRLWDLGVIPGEAIKAAL